MKEMHIVSFNSTHHAIRTDKLLNEIGIQSMTLPTPREITASCGISIRFLQQDIDKVNKILDENKIEYRGMFSIKRLEDGTKEVKQID